MEVEDAQRGRVKRREEKRRNSLWYESNSRRVGVETGQPPHGQHGKEQKRVISWTSIFIQYPSHGPALNVQVQH